VVTGVLSFVDSTVPLFLFPFSQLTGTILGTGGNAQPGSYKVSLCLCIATYFDVMVIGYGLVIWLEGFKNTIREKVKMH
jgi:hypothetical protein